MSAYDYERRGYFDRDGKEWEEDHDHPQSAWNCVVLKRKEARERREFVR